jgi:ABC-type antimicrobial peptide transport system permease subunit
MGAVTRGLRNVHRNHVRAISLIFILGLSVGSFLTVNQARSNIGEQVNVLESSVQTIIEIRPTATMAIVGMPPPQNKLQPESNADRIENIPHIVKIEKYLNARVPDGRVVGMEPGNTMRLIMGWGVTPKIIAGRAFVESDVGRNVAVAGNAFADNYGVFPQNLDGAPPITLSGTDVRAIGIFETGFSLGNNQVFLPLDVSQKIFDVEGEVSLIYVHVDSVENVAQVREDIRAVLGDDVDMFSGPQIYAAAESLAGIQSSSETWTVTMIIFGALVTLFTMVLATRERTKEIGVLKAIGASNWDVAVQFVVEAMALAAIGGLLGVIFFAALGPEVAVVLLGSLETSPLGAGYALSLSTVGYALGLVLFFGIIGSLYPVMQAVKMKPAEAIRHE